MCLMRKAGPSCQVSGVAAPTVLALVAHVVAATGFVDAHTHAVFGGDRAFEMKMKLAGATYMDVHKAGGGINFTVRLRGPRETVSRAHHCALVLQVRKTRESEQAELETALTKRLDRMLRLGTTTVEVKSGKCGRLVVWRRSL